MVRVHQPPGGETRLHDELPKKPLFVRVQQPPGGTTHIHDDIPAKPSNIRVLKPPGGGSSISFGEEDNSVPQIKAKSVPQTAAPVMNDNQDQESPKAETNGTSTPPQSPKDNASTATKENNPSTATTTNGVAINGTVTNGTSTSGSSTPNSSRLDTQSRLFGENQQPQKETTPNRRIRDHHRSNIFTEGEDKTLVAKSANPVGNETPEPKTPEAKVPEQSQPQSHPQQRQRVPPGGFSTKLW